MKNNKACKELNRYAFINLDYKCKSQIKCGRLIKRDCSPLRIKLKSLLTFLCNRCARAFTPERLQLQFLAGWQVNKINSPVCSTSILHRIQKNIDRLHSLIYILFTICLAIVLYGRAHPHQISSFIAVIKIQAPNI